MDSFPVLIIKKYWNTRRFFGGAAMISVACAANWYVAREKRRYIQELDNEGVAKVVIMGKDEVDIDVHIITSNDKDETKTTKIRSGHIITAGTEKERGTGGGTNTLDQQ